MEEIREEPEYLSEEDFAREDEFLSGIPRFNLGAFLLPPVWGPGHGLWWTILYYPVWLFADNCFYEVYIRPSGFTVTVAAVMFVTLVLVTVGFGVGAQPLAAHKAAEKGLTKEQYLKRERIWAVVCVIVGALFLGFATYYNLVIR